MGILADTLEQDIAAINWVAEVSAKAWQLSASKAPAFSGYNVAVNTDLTEDLSLFGGRLLATYFENADVYDRVATICVLANCCPFFRVWQNGRPIGIAQERRFFFARVSCAFLSAALFLYRKEGKTQAFSPSESQFARFTAFLQILDSCVVRKTSPESKKEREEEQKAFRALVTGVLGVHTFLELCCREVKVSGSEALSLALSSFPRTNG